MFTKLYRLFIDLDNSTICLGTNEMLNKPKYILGKMLIM